MYSAYKEDKQDILDILQHLNGLDALKALFWSRLSYDRVNRPLSRRDWRSETARNALAEDPVLWASGGDGDAFHVIYARLASDRLPVGMERPVVTTLLREHPYTLFVFSNAARDRWHFVNVRVAPPDDGKTAGLDRTARFVMFTVPYEQVMSAVIFDELESATGRMSRPEYRVCVLPQKALYEEGLAAALVRQRLEKARSV